MEPRHAQQPREQVGQALAQLAHQVGEGAVLADPRPPERPGQVPLGPAQVVRVCRRDRLTHGALRCPTADA